MKNQEVTVVAWRGDSPDSGYIAGGRVIKRADIRKILRAGGAVFFAASVLAIFLLASPAYADIARSVPFQVKRLSASTVAGAYAKPHRHAKAKRHAVKRRWLRP